MAELTAQGVGTSNRQAEPIPEEAENILSEKGLLGNSTGESMLNTLFFYNCKLFGLRAVDEHKTLSVDQFELGQDHKGKFINFTGRATKTYKGGLYQRHVSAKSISHHFQGEKVYNIYKEYFNLVVINSENNRFYRRPLANGENNEVRFNVQHIGVNKLSIIMKNMSDKADIPGFFSNHSGKRTCSTALYQGGVPEQEIMERRGHRSIESVRKYKRPSEEMPRDISNALEPNEPVRKKNKIKKYWMELKIRSVKIRKTRSITVKCISTFESVLVLSIFHLLNVVCGLQCSFVYSYSLRGETRTR